MVVSSLEFGKWPYKDATSPENNVLYDIIIARLTNQNSSKTIF